MSNNVLSYEEYRDAREYDTHHVQGGYVIIATNELKLIEQAVLSKKLTTFDLRLYIADKAKSFERKLATTQQLANTMQYKQLRLNRVASSRKRISQATAHVPELSDYVKTCFAPKRLLRLLAPIPSQIEILIALYFLRRSVVSATHGIIFNHHTCSQKWGFERSKVTRACMRLVDKSILVKIHDNLDDTITYALNLTHELVTK